MQIRIEADSSNKHSLLFLLQQKGIEIVSDCNGNGHCGKCKVLIKEKGYVSACQFIPHSPVKVEVPVIPSNQISSTLKYTGKPNPHSVYVDLGSSTIAFLYGDKQTLLPNPCLSFGQDIVSRIQSACDGNGDKMMKLLRELIISQIQLWTRHSHEVTDVYLAGNTAMIHLFMGYPCDTLAVSPFTPYNKKEITTTIDGLLYHIPPCIGGFLGADYVMGLLALDFQSRNNTCLFVDLGTNGELAICHKNQIYSCSVASGPAFEGGNLSCGCPSVPGAISQVTLGGIIPQVRTIHNKLPLGLCGSGAISLYYELIKKGYTDSTGILTDKFPLKGLTICRSYLGGTIIFTREDFRNVQLAISSLQAGIYTLCRHAGISPEKITHCYLAGGLGNIALPFLQHEEYVGNTCLSGLIKWTELKDFMVPETNFISLADDPFYKDELIRCMGHLC